MGGTWVDDSTTVTLNISVASDDVCTITVGGTAQPNNETDNWGRWKASPRYSYTAKANTSYVYTFEAWTQSGTRELEFNYYEDYIDEVWLSDYVTLTEDRETYTVDGSELPKGGNQLLHFQCADQTGTFYVKVLSIEEQ